MFRSAQGLSRPWMIHPPLCHPFTFIRAMPLVEVWEIQANEVRNVMTVKVFPSRSFMILKHCLARDRLVVDSSRQYRYFRSTGIPEGKIRDCNSFTSMSIPETRDMV